MLQKINCTQKKQLLLISVYCKMSNLTWLSSYRPESASTVTEVDLCVMALLLA